MPRSASAEAIDYLSEHEWRDHPEQPVMRGKYERREMRMCDENPRRCC